MGIIIVEMYTAKCDVCGVNAEFGDFTCYGDKESVRQDAGSNGWYFIDDDTCYCEECHSFNDSGDLVIKEDSL